MNTDDQHDFLSPRRGPAPLTPSELAEQLATDYPQLRIHPDAPLIGGMGAVYSATLSTSAGQHHVAIKVLHWHLMDDPAFTARFQREQALLRQLDHPNIVKLRDIGHTAEGLPFLVMDWIAGRSLTGFTQPNRDSKFNLTRQQLLRIADDLCAAVQYAHEIEYTDAEGVKHKGILHRDLKPQNIMVRDDDDRAIVLDFGIARPLTPGLTLTKAGDSPGTYGYIAPEILNPEMLKPGEKPDARADIYSLGIIIYQLLMKKLPDVFAARPSEHSLDPRFDEIVMKAAAAEREKRYASAEALRVALGSIRQTGKPEPLSMNTAPPNPRRNPKDTVIEFNDDWISINGVEFCSEPLITEIIDVLGEPDMVAMEPGSESWQWSYRDFIWLEAGLAASTARDDSMLNHRPSHQTRGDRISLLYLCLHDSKPLIGGLIPSGSSRVLYEFDLNSDRFAGSQINQTSDIMLKFQGTLRIGTIAVECGMTSRELMHKKKGRSLAQQTWQHSRPDPWATCGEGESVRAFVVSSGKHSNWETTSITRVELCFERWWNPPAKLLSTIRLHPAEKILNCFDNEEHKSGWPLYELDTHNSLKVSFTTVLTNRRLVVWNETRDDTAEWLLTVAPELSLGGETNLEIPPNLAKLVAQRKRQQFDQWKEVIVGLVLIVLAIIIIGLGSKVCEFGMSKDKEASGGWWTILVLVGAIIYSIGLAGLWGIISQVFVRVKNDYVRGPSHQKVGVVEISSSSNPPIDYFFQPSGSFRAESELQMFKQRVDAAVSKWGPETPALHIRRPVSADQTGDASSYVSNGLIACPKCQKPIADDALTCLHCGTQKTPGRQESERTIPIRYHPFAYIVALFWSLVCVGVIYWLWPQTSTTDDPTLNYWGIAFAAIFGSGRLWHLLTLKCEYFVVAPAERIVHHINGVLNQSEINVSQRNSRPGEYRPLLGRICGFSTLILKMHDGETITRHCMRVTKEARDAWRGWKERD
jgi:serine/threonine protein kinase